LEQILLSIPEK
jgi:NADH:flavin oxidoreductases, Old Yellow Enzyme family